MKYHLPYFYDKEVDMFYSHSQLSKCFGISEQELREKCEQFGIKPHLMGFKNKLNKDFFTRRFTRSDVRKLHKALHQESRGNKKAGDSHKEG